MGIRNIVDICESITDTILIADAAYAVNSWAANSGVSFDGNPPDPKYSVFREFYQCAQQLRQEYQSSDVDKALARFADLRREGKLFLLFSDRTSEIEVIRYCLRAIDQHRDLATAFQKWIN